MKKLLIFIALIVGTASIALAFPGIWNSSNTITADTTKNLCNTAGGSPVNGQAILHGVCVSTASAVAGTTMTVFASSGTSANPIALINGMVTGCYYYDVYSSTSPGGLTYTTSQQGSSFTIMYACY